MNHHRHLFGRLSILGFLVVVLATAGFGQDLERTMVQGGPSITRGDQGELAYGVTMRNFRYIDPVHPDGFYWAAAGQVTVWQTDMSVRIGDVRILQSGWRGNPLGFFGKPGLDFSFDLSAAPTLGNRVKGDRILGNYLGIGATAGLYVCVVEGVDLGISWEPCWNVLVISGPVTPNQSYQGFALYCVMKSATVKTSQPWSQPLSKP